MPMSTECLARNGRRRVTVMEALSLHDQERRKLLCIECRHPVKPHSAARNIAQAAHFEHFKRNPKCSLSDKKFR
jgi:hypothetical protein